MTRAEKRRESLRQVLNGHRHEAEAAVQGHMRHERTDRSTGVGDTLEQTDASTQNDIAFALLQMRAETLRRVNQAITRLDSGSYGTCLDCDEDIAESRLRALPFAVRCRDCAEQYERRSAAPGPSAVPAQDRLWPFAPVVGP